MTPDPCPYMEVFPDLDGVHALCCYPGRPRTDCTDDLCPLDDEEYERVRDAD